MRIIFFSSLLLYIFTIPCYSDIIYEWIDEKGVKNYSNKTSVKAKKEVNEINFPDRDNSSYSSPNTSEQGTYTEQQEKIKKEVLEKEKRNYWRSLALAIEEEQQRTLYEIDQIKDNIYRLKKEVDYYLLNGYAADYLIYELRNLESQIEPLERKFELLKNERVLLKKEARKNGIPPGYLRP